MTGAAATATAAAAAYMAPVLYVEPLLCKIFLRGTSVDLELSCPCDIPKHGACSRPRQDLTLVVLIALQQLCKMLLLLFLLSNCLGFALDMLTR